VELGGGFRLPGLGERERERVLERSVNGNSLSMRTWKDGSFTGNTESYVTHIKKALTIEHPSPCIGCVRGSWNEGSYAEDSKRHAIEGAGNGAFPL